MENQRAILEMHGDAGERRIYELGASTLIGRGAEADICIQDGAVSRRHCIVEGKDGQFSLRDLDSANGTFINENKVVDAVLREGDKISVGGAPQTLVFTRTTANIPDRDQTILAATQISSSIPPFAFVGRESTADEMHGALQRFKLLYQANEIISCILKPEELFDRILDQIFEALPVDVGTILLGSTAETVQIASQRAKVGLRDDSEPSRTLLQRVFAKHEALLVVDAETDDQLQAAESVVRSGLRSLMAAPIVHADRIVGVLQCCSHSRAGAFTQEDLEVVAAIARQTAIALSNIHLVEQLQLEAEARGNLKRYNERLEQDVNERTVQLNEALRNLREGYLDTIHRLTLMAEQKDESTASHIKRVGGYCAHFARELGWSQQDIETIEYAAPMHDIGKVAIPAEILLKQSKLTAEEFALMQTHASIGARILSGSKSHFLQMAERIALSHHERFDGSGKPQGLKGEAIPIEARIMTIGDQYDALRSSRPYKPAFDHEKTCKIILEGDGRTMPQHFDPKLLAIFASTHPVLRDIYEQLRD